MTSLESSDRNALPPPPACPIFRRLSPPPPVRPPPPPPPLKPVAPPPPVRPPPPPFKPPPPPPRHPPPPPFKPPPPPRHPPPPPFKPPPPPRHPPPPPFKPPPPPRHPPPPFKPPPPPRHPPPPPFKPIAPPPPINPPPPPAPTIIIIVFVSVGSLCFLALLGFVLCMLAKRRRKRTNETDITIHVDEHMNLTEALIPGPRGPKPAILSVEEDVHIDEVIRKKETSDRGLHARKKLPAEEISGIEEVETTSTSGNGYNIHQNEDRP